MITEIRLQQTCFDIFQTDKTCFDLKETCSTSELERKFPRLDFDRHVLTFSRLDKTCFHERNMFNFRTGTKVPTIRL